MATERERFDEIASMLRSEDREFVLRTERLARGVGDPQRAVRRDVTLSALVVLLMLGGMVASLAWATPLVGVGVYLAAVLTLNVLLGRISRSRAERWFWWLRR